MSVRPGRQVEPLAERFRAAGEERPERENEHLFQCGRHVGGQTLGVESALGPRRRGVPLRHERLERVAVAGERADSGVVGALERFVAEQDVGRAGAASGGNRSSRAGCRRSAPAGRPSRCCVREPVRVRLDPRQRDARLHAALHVDERQLHVDRGCQVGLSRPELLEFDDFAWLGPGDARRMVRHSATLSVRRPVNANGSSNQSGSMDPVVAASPEIRGQMLTCDDKKPKNVAIP